MTFSIYDPLSLHTPCAAHVVSVLGEISGSGWGRARREPEPGEQDLASSQLAKMTVCA